MSAAHRVQGLSYASVTSRRRASTSTSSTAPEYGHNEHVEAPATDDKWQSSDDSPVRVKEPLRTSVTRVALSILVVFGIVSLPTLIVCCFVPIIMIFALPSLFFLFLSLTFGVSHLAYLLLAQTDAPPHLPLPFVTWNIRRCLLVDRAVLMYLRESATLLRLTVVGWVKRKLSVKNVGVRRNVHYGSPRLGMRLDVYYPLDCFPKRPVIVFLPPQLRFMPSARAVFSILAYNLAHSLKAIVVIPDIASYPFGGRLPAQVEDTRFILRWVAENAGKLGGDAQKIYLMGHGLSGLLALLVPIQDAVVHAREDHKSSTGDWEEKMVPNGIRGLTIYAEEVEVPKIEGLILIAPISDVDHQIMHESSIGVHSISLVRRVCGPTQVTSLHHSPSHLIYASRDFDVTERLPQKFLFLHGGLDQTVPHNQTEVIKELLHGMGAKDVRMCIFGCGHFDPLFDLMRSRADQAAQLPFDQMDEFLNK